MRSEDPLSDRYIWEAGEFDRMLRKLYQQNAATFSPADEMHIRISSMFDVESRDHATVLQLLHPRVAVHVRITRDMTSDESEDSSEDTFLSSDSLSHEPHRYSDDESG